MEDDGGSDHHVPAISSDFRITIQKLEPCVLAQSDPSSPINGLDRCHGPLGVILLDAQRFVSSTITQTRLGDRVLTESQFAAYQGMTLRRLEDHKTGAVAQWQDIRGNPVR